MKNVFILLKCFFSLIVLFVCLFVSSFNSFGLSEKPAIDMETIIGIASASTDTAKTRTEDEIDGPNFSWLKDLSIGGGYGLSLIYGDLANYDVFPKVDYFDTYFNYGYRLYAQRHIKWGWGVKLQFDKGNLQGKRQPGKYSAVSRFKSTYIAGSIAANYDVLNLISKKPWNKRRLYIDGNVGIGYLGYRSILMYDRNDEVRNFYGFEALDKTANISHKQLHDRLGMAKTVTLPIGATMGIRINHKADITINVSQTTVFTDELDAWVRDWTATDKFGYFGVGFRYNFNRTIKDLPELKPKKEKKRKERKEKQKTAKLRNEIGKGMNSGHLAMLPKPRRRVNLFGNLFRGRSTKRMKKEAEAYGVMLKVLEMQMLLLEKQYLK